jgi:Flp pilus assembly pilin Flp
MKPVLASIARFVRDEYGQDLTEYGLLAALVACFAIAAVGVLGRVITDTFWSQVVQLAQNI